MKKLIVLFFKKNEEHFDLKKKYIKGPKIAAFQYYGEAVKS